MSSDSPYFQISLDQYALSILVKTLEYSKNALLFDDFNSALIQLSFAWDLLPNALKNYLEEPPRNILEKRLSSEIPTDEDMLANPEFDGRSPRQRARQREQWAQEITANFLNEYFGKMIAALDAAGLYIKGQLKIKPTADKKAEIQPPLTKLPENLPR